MEKQLMLLIILLGVVNFGIRFLPAMLLNRFTLPQVVEDWLSFVPVATMAAIVVPALLQGEGNDINFSWQNFYLLSAIPTIIVAAKTKSLGYSLAVGMGAMALLQYFK